MAHLPKTIYRVDAIPIKNSSIFFCLVFQNRAVHPKIHMDSQRTMTNQTILKKNKVRGLKLSDFKTYYKAIIIQIVWYWHKERHRPTD